MYCLNLFGAFSLADSNGVEIPLKSGKAKALLAYLALPPGKPRSREEIMALLWSERGEAQARASLRQVLTGLRKALGEDAASLLHIEHETVALDSERVTIPETNAEEFLAGFHLNDPAFEDWLRDERLRFVHDGPDSPGPKPGSEGARDIPAIAVLPFQNLSGDPEQEYFSDGITEDIITELSRFQSLFVISSTSSFAFRGKEIDPVDAGEKLVAGFLVQGSVRKAGSRVRISTQLIDATTAGHLWSDRFDRDMTDIFSLQDEIAATVATMVSGHVDIASRVKSERKQPRDINAYELVCRSDWYGYTDFRSDEVSRLLEQAIKMDPTYAEAHAKFAVHRAFSIFVDALNPGEVIPIVKKHGALAAQLAPGDAMVHAPLAEAYAFLGEHELAAHHLEQSLKLNPNAFRVMAHSAEAAALLGDHRTGLELIEKAMLRDPYNSLSFRENKFDIYFLAGRYEDALVQLVGWPNPPIHMGLAKVAALAQLGRISEAQDAVRELEAKRPEGWDVCEVMRSYHRMCAMPEDGERWLEGFRRAGLRM
jgi:TolB-like protein